MASAADYYSTVGLLVFVQELTLLAYFLVRADHNVDSERDGPIQSEVPGADKKLDDREEHLDDDTRFLFDVVARQNEGVIQNIDALDNGLIAVSVGVIAVTLFAADKWFDLDPNFRFAGFFFLIESAVVALFGYLAICFTGSATDDIVRFGDFTVDFSESAAKATLSAISDIARSRKANVVARRYKRTFLILATLLAVVAAAVIVAGRALGDPSSH